MKALVFGASAGVGRALTEALAARGYGLLLIATDAQDLDAQAKYLRLIYEIEVITVTADATYPDDCLERIRVAAISFGKFDTMLFPIGVSRADDNGTLSLPNIQQLINANLTIVAGTVSLFLADLINADNGNVVGFGSIAAIRGRQANIIYAAAKRGLESYFESLRHLTAKTGVRVQFYRLGYVATQQSFGQRLPLSAATPERIAETVVRNLGRDKGRTYLPNYWLGIACIVSILPWAIFKRLNF